MSSFTPLVPAINRINFWVFLQYPALSEEARRKMAAQIMDTLTLRTRDLPRTKADWMWVYGELSGFFIHPITKKLERFEFSGCYDVASKL
jgi:hypothetical protein